MFSNVHESNLSWYNYPCFDAFWASYRIGNEWIKQSNQEESNQLENAFERQNHGAEEGDPKEAEVVSQEYLEFVSTTIKHRSQRG